MQLTQTRPIAGTREEKTPGVAATRNSRITSIDILRATTMLLMIFVNDLWSLSGIPAWLEHVPASADGMGLADTVFPAFLFIVGMSIPYAIDNRQAKGDDTATLVRHIISRSAALLIMGVFLVNGENINATATGIPRSLWNPLCCLSFILIWNAYPASIKKSVKRTLQAIGITVLLVLAVMYRGGEDNSLQYFSTYWWGILGLIGWCYLAASLVTVFARKKTIPLVLCWVLFCALSMVSSARLIPKESLLHIIPSAILGGTLVALALGGVLTTLLFQHLLKTSAPAKMLSTLVFISLGLFALGIITNRFWDISKIRATTPWLFLCSAITIFTFALVYWLADVKGKASWFSFIKPAGTNTLLCYLIPYFAYAVSRLSGLHLPPLLLTGATGLLKCFAFALLCIWITGLLARRGIRLKL
jgi:heparan-alpha-glucosaminide N-acetyltransferase